jgi:hypothetical protein
MPRVPDGNWSTCHVTPPSLDNMMAPLYGPSGLAVTPEARHVDDEGQVTPIMVVLAIGNAETVHDDPPLLVEIAAPCPTATQSEADSHETASSTGIPDGNAELDQVWPPSLLIEATPTPLLSEPTATHVDASVHDTALKLP